MEAKSEQQEPLWEGAEVEPDEVEVGTAPEQPAADTNGASRAAETADETVSAPTFVTSQKAVLSKDEQGKLVLARIRELEEGIFRDELAKYELELYAPGSQENVEVQKRLAIAAVLQERLIALYNDWFTE